MDTQNHKPVEVFVPASDADLDTNNRGVGLMGSQVFRDCDSVDPLPPRGGPVSRGAATARRRG